MIIDRKFTKKSLALAAVAASMQLLLHCGVAMASEADVPAADAAPTDISAISEIVVTARRKAESAQTVPVSVDAFAASDLVEHNVQSTQDLQSLTPGVVFSGAGSAANTTFSIRGQGKDVIGPGLPSVISYLNEVPLPSWGSVLPTFDVSSVQVLKGPQGTLFGRNTTGGAVLVYSTEPSFETGGYAQATFGSYDWTAFQGALNIPLIDNILAVRVATDIERREGYTKATEVDADNNPIGSFRQDNLKSNSFRISVLFQPSEDIKNVLVADYYDSTTNYVGNEALYLSGVQPWLASPLLTSAFGCTTSITCSTALQVARQQSLGPTSTYTDVRPFDDDLYWGISNTTTWKVVDDWLSVKNIVGYRSTHVNQAGNTDGIALAILNSSPDTRTDGQFSEELQLTGDLFNKKLNWLVGAFYLDDRPTGTDALGFDLLRPSFIPLAEYTLSPLTPSKTSSTLYSDRSTAGFINLNYDFSGISDALQGLSVDTGFRHTWDNEGVCATLAAPLTSTPVSTLQQCETTPGVFSDSAPFQASTYNVSLDYALNKDLFFYFTNRRGYRAGGINTPAFSPDLAQYQTYKPQVLNDVELGAKTHWRAAGVEGTVDLSVFRGKFTNLQVQAIGLYPGDPRLPDVTAQNDPSNSSLVTNAASAIFEGAELSGVIVPIEGLKVGYGASYLNPYYTSVTATGIIAPFIQTSAFSNSPKWSYSANLEYTLPIQSSVGKVVLGTDFYHIGDYYQGFLLIHGYNLENIRVDLDGAFGTKADISLFVNNVGDKEYLTDPSLSTPSLGLYTSSYGAPRMAGIRLRYSF